ncbi:MAG: hypothetical protein PHQ59_00185 [Candidatus Daviesbacteria bacterium]|nr:hypothetical protein [Candidatus Daviesbacteria bacterium]
MSIEGESISVDSFSSVGAGISALSSPGIGMGSEFSSFSNFSSFETSGLSGGSLNPGVDIFSSPSIDITPIPSIFNESLADINLDPTIPSFEVPQIFQEAFTDNFAEDILTPPTYLESILESSRPSSVFDIPIETNIDTIFEQTNFMPDIEEPISQPEEFADLKAPVIEEIVQSEAIFDLIDENIIHQPIPELISLDTDQINDEPVFKAAEELVSLSEQSPALSEIVTTSIETSEILQISDQAYPEIAQATIAYESLITAGIAETQAVELVENALIQAGNEPEIVTQMMVQAQLKSEQKVSVVEEVEAIEKAEERVQKEAQYKFVLDEDALANRDEVLKLAVESVIEGAEGEEIIDARIVAANMLTEIENQAVKSGILTKNILEVVSLFYQGDGSYRLFVSAIGKLGLQSRLEILKRGLEFNRKFIPVTIAENGKRAEEEDVKRVVNHQPNSIPGLRTLASQSAV